jgi:hypothetical protein
LNEDSLRIDQNALATFIETGRPSPPSTFDTPVYCALREVDKSGREGFTATFRFGEMSSSAGVLLEHQAEGSTR